MTITALRTGSTRAARPEALRRRVGARIVVPALAGVAIAALAVTAAVQLAPAAQEQSGVASLASVAELTASGSQGYAVEGEAQQPETQAESRTSDLAGIVVETPTPTPTASPSASTDAADTTSDSTPKTSTDTTNVSSDPSVDATLARIAQCESGGNPAAVNPAGYYGLYQFSIPTWQSVGGTGLPSEASVEEQTMRAKMLQAKAGWGQWSCY